MELMLVRFAVISCLDTSSTSHCHLAVIVSAACGVHLGEFPSLKIIFVA